MIINEIAKAQGAAGQSNQGEAATGQSGYDQKAERLAESGKVEKKATC